MLSKLYVGNLAYSVSNDDLHDLFSQVGQVQSATVVTDKFSGQSKGFGFIEMTTGEEVANAIRQFNETELGSEHQGERGPTTRVELRWRQS
jgi:RNA recognition motif-containing protein